MAANAGYSRALDLARERLASLDPAAVALGAGVVWNGETFEIPWLGRTVLLEEGAADERIIWLHYLLAGGPKKTRGVYISYKQVPGAAIYDSNFVKRTVAPMVETFHERLDDFMRLGLAMGGEAAELGHASFTVRVLPFVPLTYVIWQGDDEIPPSGNILFDETAIEWFCAEDLVVLAGMPVYKMLRELR